MNVSSIGSEEGENNSSKIFFFFFSDKCKPSTKVEECQIIC